MKTTTRIVLGAFLCVLLGVSQASAEFYVAGYGGAAFTNNQNVDVSDPSGNIVGVPASGTFQDVDLNTSALYGGKIGYFLDSWHYFGVEAEAYHFSPDVDSQTVQASGTATVNGMPFSGTLPFAINSLDVGVTTAAVNFILRGMLEESDAFPLGRLQGYIGVGGGAFIANLDVPQLGSDTSTVVGGQALAGVKWFPIEGLPLSLFAEYKFIFTDNFKFDLSGTTIKTDLTSNLVYGGIAYHF